MLDHSGAEQGKVEACASSRRKGISACQTLVMFSKFIATDHRIFGIWKQKGARFWESS